MKLPSSAAIQRAIKAAKDAGIPIGAVDITTNGVTIYAPSKEATGTAFDRWKNKQGEARPTHS